MISELQLPRKRKATHSCKSRDTGKVILIFFLKFWPIFIKFSSIHFKPFRMRLLKSLLIGGITAASIDITENDVGEMVDLKCHVCSHTRNHEG